MSTKIFHRFHSDKPIAHAQTFNSWVRGGKGNEDVPEEIITRRGQSDH